MDTVKITGEMAEQEFDRWVEAMSLDLESGVIDENDARDTASDKNRIIKYIEKGAATVDGEGVLSFEPMPADKMPDRVTFYTPNGMSYLSMDYKKATSSVAKMFASIATITKCKQDIFLRMRAPDIKFCMAVWNFFLA